VFVTPEEFIKPLLESYPKTVKALRQLLERTEDQVQRSIISEAIDDMQRALKTVKAYYSPGGAWDEEYCCLSRLHGSSTFGCDSLVEELVTDGHGDMGGSEQFESDTEFEARAEKSLRTGSYIPPARDDISVLDRRAQTTADSRGSGN
jgi:hypothetical protein